MNVTLREAAAVLDPPVTARQVATLTVLARIDPSGVRRTGRIGRPPDLYDLAEIQSAHAEEAVRTPKQFTDTDWIASALLARHLILADIEQGALWWPDGTRAEQLHADLYGYVHVRAERCPAHRVIWIAAGGQIPPSLQVNHINRLRWDNRLDNLEIVTFGNKIRHDQGSPYINYHDAVNGLAELRPEPPRMPPPAENLMRAGGAFRRDVTACL